VITTTGAVSPAKKAEALTIYQIIPLIRAEVGAIRKDQQAQGGARYSYRGTDSIINALAPALNKYGVFTTVEDFDYEHTAYETASKKMLTTVTMKKKVTFYGPLGDSVYSIVAGENSDYSDKATGGASTYAYRYALVQTFVLPTDDDDPDAKYVEREAPASAGAQPATQQVSTLKALQDSLRIASTNVKGDLKGSAYLSSLVEANPELFANQAGEPLSFAQVWADESKLKSLAEIFRQQQG